MVSMGAARLLGVTSRVRGHLCVSLWVQVCSGPPPTFPSACWCFAVALGGLWVPVGISPHAAGGSQGFVPVPWAASRLAGCMTYCAEAFPEWILPFLNIQPLGVSVLGLLHAASGDLCDLPPMALGGRTRLVAFAHHGPPSPSSSPTRCLRMPRWALSLSVDAA